MITSLCYKLIRSSNPSVAFFSAKSLTFDEAFEDFPFLHESQIRWGDMDAYGHLNNIKFIQFFVLCYFLIYLLFNRLLARVY